MKQQNKQQKKKVHSIRGQFAWIFIGLMIGTILLCLLLNYMFLGRVYMQSKMDVIHDAYETSRRRRVTAMDRKNSHMSWMMCAEAIT